MSVQQGNIGLIFILKTSNHGVSSLIHTKSINMMNNNEISKEKLIEFFLNIKWKYLKIGKTPSNHMLHTAFKRREIYKKIENSVNNIINERMDYNNEKTSTKNKKTLFLKVAGFPKYSQELDRLVQDIHNGNVFSIPTENDAIGNFNTENFSGVNRLTFLDVFIASRNKHKNTKSHIKLIKKLDSYLLFDRKNILNIKKISDESLKIDIINSYSNLKKILPDNYANPIDKGNNTHSWISIDLSLSDEILRNNFAHFLTKERERKNIIDVDNIKSVNIAWKENIIRDILIKDIFIIIDIKSMALHYKIDITNREILDIIGGHQKTDSYVSKSVEYFINTFTSEKLPTLHD
ncbi:hypothetical protein [Yersinia enterocolitica]|nr:hypothetical protein [Yersinia enterocolitica]ELI8323567.1 hypothetical protein [Yersinia enterocolitica]HDL6696205.1 hypothetical protein [Yersinia enterocolitica]HEI6939021.1 hypothetical protein [Yersinia enterocolitica]